MKLKQMRIDVEEDFYYEIKQQALNERTSMKEIFIKAFTEYIENHNN